MYKIPLSRENKMVKIVKEGRLWKVIRLNEREKKPMMTDVWEIIAYLCVLKNHYTMHSHQIVIPRMLFVIVTVLYEWPADKLLPFWCGWNSFGE